MSSKYDFDVAAKGIRSTADFVGMLSSDSMGEANTVSLLVANPSMRVAPSWAT
jgi:hypothetical protein